MTASLALFIALGGVGWAATQLPKNSVGTKQLKNGAVTAKKINAAARRELAAAAGAGPVGPVGPSGPPGAPGEPGSARAYARVTPEAGLDVAHSKGVIAVVPTCAPGEGPAECSAPPESDPEWVRFCFKLGFVPDNVQVTPIMGRSYAPDAALHVEAQAPAGGPSTVYKGCKAGYRDAEVRAWKEASGFEGDPALPGFFVLFN